MKERVLLTTLNAKYVHTALSLRYLREAGRRQGMPMVLREYTINQQLRDILADIYAERPDIIGFSCYIWNIEMTLQLVVLLRQVLPEVAIILGGPEVSYRAGQLLSEQPAVDFVVQGEGEESFPLLVRAVQTGTSCQDIKGVACRTATGIRENGGVQVIADLDQLPFPYQWDELKELTGKMIYYESSRGCPFSCQYCLSGSQRGVRFLPVPRVLKELELLVAANARQVKFVDRTFNASVRHHRPIVEYLSGLNCQTNFHFEVAADILDTPTIHLLTQAPSGRFQLEIGVQSTHPPTLRAIQRIHNWENLQRNVNLLHANPELHMHLDLIAGLPLESYTAFAQSFNDVYALRPQMLQLGFLKMLPGCGIRESAVQYGYQYTEQPPYEVLSHDCLSYAEVRQLQILESVFEQTYNSGRFNWVLDYLTEDVSAFSLYEKLAAYWEQQEYHKQALSPVTIRRIFGEFLYACRPKQAELAMELLKLDALRGGEGQSKADFLPWGVDFWQEPLSRIWREESWLRRYLPNYSFTSWRDLKRKYHLEIISPDALSRLKPAGTGQAQALLFDYTAAISYWQPVELPPEFLQMALERNSV